MLFYNAEKFSFIKYPAGMADNAVIVGVEGCDEYDARLFGQGGKVFQTRGLTAQFFAVSDGFRATEAENGNVRFGVEGRGAFAAGAAVDRLNYQFFLRDIS